MSLKMPLLIQKRTGVEVSQENGFGFSSFTNCISPPTKYILKKGNQRISLQRHCTVFGSLKDTMRFLDVQCNAFEGADGEVSLTAAGGLRKIPGLTEVFENAALVGVHYDGIFYEFVPWNGVVSWEINQWGYWYISAENESHMVELVATTKDPGTTLRAPTTEAGLAPACKDNCSGALKLQIWKRTYNGSKGKMILDVTSNMAAVEVGGGPWFNTWKGKTAAPELVRLALQVPVDEDAIFGLAPFFKPPGL
ncbi:Tocopherol cyclase, chloroplastic [Vitis vinifera]|uniref:Tocopherol cyclase, chloroplastic n=1 Tax=Vitis vinifera TaxID=29760 RepID=A0A438K7W7_VITVI|nr:Tocopherol cyclase, chloroplastic [Vitis vinifera]